MSVSISSGGGVGITVESDPTALKIVNNLSDVSDAGAVKENLGIVDGIPAYNNDKTYQTNEQVLFDDKIYRLNSFIGAAGYSPSGNPEYWTEISAAGGGSANELYLSGYSTELVANSVSLKTQNSSYNGSVEISTESGQNATLACSQADGYGYRHAGLFCATDSLGASLKYGYNVTASQSGWQVDAPIIFADGTAQTTAYTGGGGGGGVDIQTFGSPTTSGTFTWTKPVGAKWVEFYLWGAGGGGGAGGRFSTTAPRFGGGGGGAGGYLHLKIEASSLNATETVTVATGGLGATSQTTDSTTGANAQDTYITPRTQFSLWSAGNGGFGSGGSSVSGSGGSSVTNSILGNFLAGCGGGQGSSSAGAPPTFSGLSQTAVVGLGGAGGAGSTAANVNPNAGGNGLGISTLSVTHCSVNVAIAGGAGGTTAGIQATNGVSSTTSPLLRGGTGGGSGFFIPNQAGGKGGNGGWPAGGGGGGGASNNGFASGAGGNGANGYAVIITYF